MNLVLSRIFLQPGRPRTGGKSGTAVDVQRLGGGDGAVGAGGGVVESAQCRVAGTRVVPGVGGFLSGLVEAFGAG